VKITIVPTSTLTELDGVPVRLWTGQTESGIRVCVAVHRVIVNEVDQQAEFQRDLHECVPPADDRRLPAGQAITRVFPLRMVT